MKQMSFMAACKDYFGMRQGQTLSEFLAEVKALTMADREELKVLFKSVGYEITG